MAAERLGNFVVELASGTIYVDILTGMLRRDIESYITGQFQYQCGVKSKLEKLKHSMTVIQSAIGIATQEQNKEQHFLEWFNQIKDAIYDAEDVLDKFAYNKLEDEVENRELVGQELPKFLQFLACDVDKLLESAKTFVARLCFLDEDLNDLGKIVSTFDGLASQILTFIQISKAPSQARASVVPETQDEEGPSNRIKTSTPYETKLYGRDDMKAEITKQLTKHNSDESKNYSVICIFGIGGVGKTTLAQFIFNDENVKDQFQVKAWVSVMEKFSIKKIKLAIMESASIEMPQNIHDQTLQSIENCLQKGIKDKKLFIVLDDVWETMKSADWESLLNSFTGVKKGSKILVTTRTIEVGKHIEGAKCMIKLPRMHLHFREYFLRCAFGQSNPEEYPNLNAIGQKIADKLDGIPLAAKVIGAVLRTNLNENHWRMILGSNVFARAGEEDGVMETLKLSYNHLPDHLKKCFIFCSLFPRGYHFHISELASLWLAHGWIQDKNKTEDYVREFLTRSFFLGTNQKNVYMVQNFLHDLATLLGGEEFHRVEDDDSLNQIPSRVKHLYIGHGTLETVIAKVTHKRLRSLVFAPEGGKWSLTETDRNKLRSLRMLIIRSHFDTNSLAVIGEFVHLRSLTIESQDLSSSGNIEFPESICNLYQLKMLFIPQGQLEGLHKLINLQTFNVGCQPFDVLGSHVVVQKGGFKMSNFRSLNKIKGSLHIDIKNDIREEEAREAKLDEKKDIEKLWLMIATDLQEKVFEELRPHENLKDLQIAGNVNGIGHYTGKRLPDWLGKSWTSKLQNIALGFCTSLETLPTLGNLPDLRYLYLWNLPSVEKIASEFYGEDDILFPSLQFLGFRLMTGLQEWDVPKERRNLFPCLRLLHIIQCPKLRGPIPLPTSTKKFTAEVFGTKQDDQGYQSAILFSTQENARNEAIQALDRSPSELTYITDDISLLVSEPQHDLDGKFERHHTSLKMLTCNYVTAFPSCLPSLSSLEELTIQASFYLNGLPVNRLPISLKKLHIHACGNVLELHDLTRLSSLEELRISHCYKMCTLSELPTSLKKLSIYECSKLAKVLLDWREGGSEWYKISFIDQIRINGEDIHHPHNSQ